MSSPNTDPCSSSDELKDALLAAFGDEARCWLEDDDQNDEKLSSILAGQTGGSESSNKSTPTSERTFDAILNDLTAEFDAGSSDSDSVVIDQSNDEKEEQSDDEQDVGPRHTVFEVGDHVFGIPITGVREIDRCGNVTVLPRTPAWLRGVTNLRGQVLSVTDFSKLLDLPGDRQSASEKIIVVYSERHNMHTALVVDRVLGIRNLSGQREPLAELSDRITNFADSVSVTDEATTILINPDELLGCEELTQFASQS